MIKIAPSILSADFANLQKEIESVSSADWLHIDVMDGIFVPNISIGVPVVKSLRKITGKVLDVHLMITAPGRFTEAFLDAGADILVFHLEADEPQNIFPAIESVKNAGRRVGLSLKPKTPAEFILPYLPLLDLVLVMTVEPGFGGQSFMHSQLPKISAIRSFISKGGHACDLEVDGGVDVGTAPLVKEAGANVLVAGSAVFGAEDREKIISELRG